MQTVRLLSDGPSEAAGSGQLHPSKDTCGGCGDESACSSCGGDSRDPDIEWSRMVADRPGQSLFWRVALGADSYLSSPNPSDALVEGGVRATLAAVSENAAVVGHLFAPVTPTQFPWYDWEIPPEPGFHFKKPRTKIGPVVPDGRAPTPVPGGNAPPPAAGTSDPPPAPVPGGGAPGGGGTGTGSKPGELPLPGTGETPVTPNSPGTGPCCCIANGITITVDDLTNDDTENPKTGPKIRQFKYRVNVNVTFKFGMKYEPPEECKMEFWEYAYQTEEDPQDIDRSGNNRHPHPPRWTEQSSVEHHARPRSEDTVAEEYKNRAVGPAMNECKESAYAYVDKIRRLDDFLVYQTFRQTGGCGGANEVSSVIEGKDGKIVSDPPAGGATGGPPPEFSKPNPGPAPAFWTKNSKTGEWQSGKTGREKTR